MVLSLQDADESSDTPIFDLDDLDLDFPPSDDAALVDHNEIIPDVVPQVVPSLSESPHLLPVDQVQASTTSDSVLNGSPSHFRSLQNKNLAGRETPAQSRANSELTLRKALQVRNDDELLRWLQQDWVIGACDEYATAMLDPIFAANQSSTHPCDWPSSSAKYIVNNATKAIETVSKRYLTVDADTSGWTRDDYDIRFVSRLVAEGKMPGRWWGQDNDVKATCQIAHRLLSWIRCVYRVVAKGKMKASRAKDRSCMWVGQLNDARKMLHRSPLADGDHVHISSSRGSDDIGSRASEKFSTPDSPISISSTEMFENDKESNNANLSPVDNDDSYTYLSEDNYHGVRDDALPTDEVEPSTSTPVYDFQTAVVPYQNDCQQFSSSWSSIGSIPSLNDYVINDIIGFNDLTDKREMNIEDILSLGITTTATPDPNPPSSNEYATDDNIGNSTSLLAHQSNVPNITSKSNRVAGLFKMPVYSVADSQQIQGQIKGLEWMTAAGRDRFLSQRDQLLSSWGVTAHHQQSCVMVPVDWAYLNPANLLETISNSEFPAANATRLRFSMADHATSWARASAWFSDWPHNGIEFDNFMGNGPFMPMEGSHLCHRGPCVNPNHVVYESSAENASRKLCYYDAQEARLHAAYQEMPTYCQKHEPPCDLLLASLTHIEACWIQIAVLRESLQLPALAAPEKPTDHPFPTFEFHLPLSYQSNTTEHETRVSDVTTAKTATSKDGPRTPILYCSFCNHVKTFRGVLGYFTHVRDNHKDIPTTARLTSIKSAATVWREHMLEAKARGNGIGYRDKTWKILEQAAAPNFSWETVMTWKLRNRNEH